MNPAEYLIYFLMQGQAKKAFWGDQYSPAFFAPVQYTRPFLSQEGFSADPVSTFLSHNVSYSRSHVDSMCRMRQTPTTSLLGPCRPWDFVSPCLSTCQLLRWFSHAIYLAATIGTSWEFHRLLYPGALYIALGGGAQKKLCGHVRARRRSKNARKWRPPLAAHSRVGCFSLCLLSRSLE